MMIPVGDLVKFARGEGEKKPQEGGGWGGVGVGG